MMGTTAKCLNTTWAGRTASKDKNLHQQRTLEQCSATDGSHVYDTLASRFNPKPDNQDRS